MASVYRGLAEARAIAAGLDGTNQPIDLLGFAARLVISATVTSSWGAMRVIAAPGDLVLGRVNEGDRRACDLILGRSTRMISAAATSSWAGQ
ncbi:hypothetical protein [Nonomuraea endophytica]|uniref:hypothetical protein n=1 Tax=Nonomuraea endophytica TaxID=714136 RepID=UPI0037C91970